MSVYELLACCKRAEVNIKWPTPSMYNKPKMLTTNPIQVVPGQRQEYRIDSSVTRLYEIDLKRQISLLQTFIKLGLLVLSYGSVGWSRLSADCRHARRPRVVAVVTNGHIVHRRARSRAFIAGHVILSDESLLTLDFLDRRDWVWRRWTKWHAITTMRFHDRFGGGSVMVCGGITMIEPFFILCKDGSLGSVCYNTDWYSTQ